MKESFYASACIDGLQGGAAYLTDDGFHFRCQKATIAEEYKNLKIAYENIKTVSSGKRVLFTPTTIIETNSGKSYRFLIFGREKFMNDISKKLTRAENTI